MTSASRKRRWWRSLAVVAVVSLLAASALAEPSPDEVKAADAAFDEGKRLAREGELERACAAFEKSQQLAPASGTLLNLGDCYERLGKTATAWATFRASAAIARDKGSKARVKEALARAAALESRVSKVVVVVADDVRRDGLSVTHDGVPLEETLWNDEVPVDPGEHRLVVEAPDHASFERRYEVSSSARVVELLVPPLMPLGDAPAAASVAAPSDDTQWITGIVVGSVGVVAVGVGLGVGLSAMSVNGRSNDEGCSEGLCTPEGLALRQRALTQSHVATAVTTAGLAHVAVGLILMLTAPDDEPPVEPSADVASSSMTVGLRGRW